MFALNAKHVAVDDHREGSTQLLSDLGFLALFECDWFTGGHNGRFDISTENDLGFLAHDRGVEVWA